MTGEMHGGCKISSESSSSSTPFSITTSVGADLFRLVNTVSVISTLIEETTDDAAVRQLSALRAELKLVTCEDVADDNVLYCAVPVFIPLLSSGDNYMQGPKKEIVDVLRQTAIILCGTVPEAWKLHSKTKNADAKAILGQMYKNLASAAKRFEARTEHVRQQREALVAANADRATSISMDVERWLNAALDEVSSGVKMIGQLGAAEEKETKEAAMFCAVSLEKFSLVWRRAKEGSQELISSKLNFPSYKRSLERALGFSFQVIRMVHRKLELLAADEKRNHGCAQPLLEHFSQLAETFWIIRKIVLQRYASWEIPAPGPRR